MSCFSIWLPGQHVVVKSTWNVVLSGLGGVAFLHEQPQANSRQEWYVGKAGDERFAQCVLAAYPACNQHRIPKYV